MLNAKTRHINIQTMLLELVRHKQQVK